MEPSDDIYIRELSMLTGKINKDRSYLYYLLIKDGSYFKKEEPKPEEIKDASTVSDLESWFNEI